MIEEEKAEGAVKYLRDTAEKYGKLRGHMEYCDGRLRRVKSLLMMGKPGSVAERETQAYASEAYEAALKDLENATAEYETIRALREAAVYTIEVWRSQSATKRQGINV